jgi:hypothetical protein
MFIEVDFPSSDFGESSRAAREFSPKSVQGYSPSITFDSYGVRLGSSAP